MSMTDFSAQLRAAYLRAMRKAFQVLMEGQGKPPETIRRSLGQSFGKRWSNKR